MEDEKTASREGKGVIKQLLGVVFLSLGFLNSMLTLKGGLEPDRFNFALLGIGAVLLAIGAWQGRK